MNILIIILIFFIITYLFNHFLSGFVLYVKIWRKLDDLIENHIYQAFPFILPNRYVQFKTVNKKEKNRSKFRYYIQLFIYAIFTFVFAGILILLIIFANNIVVTYLLMAYSFGILIVHSLIKTIDIHEIYTYDGFYHFPFPHLYSSGQTYLPFLHVRVKNKKLEMVFFRWQKFIPPLIISIVVGLMLFLF